MIKPLTTYVTFPCKDCPNRTIEPNCHSTCETYLKLKEQNDEIRTGLINDKHKDSYVIEQIIRSNKLNKYFNKK